MKRLALMSVMLFGVLGMGRVLQAQSPYMGSPYGMPYPPAQSMGHHHHNSTHGANYGNWNHPPMPSYQSNPYYPPNNGWNTLPGSGYYPGYPTSTLPGMHSGYHRNPAHNYPQAWHPGHYLLGT